MSHKYTHQDFRIQNLSNEDAQLEQLDALEVMNAWGVARPWSLELDKYIEFEKAGVPEWQRKDDQRHMKLKHKRNGAKGTPKCTRIELAIGDAEVIHISSPVGTAW